MKLWVGFRTPGFYFRSVTNLLCDPRKFCPQSGLSFLPLKWEDWGKHRLHTWLHIRVDWRAFKVIAAPAPPPTTSFRLPEGAARASPFLKYSPGDWNSAKVESHRPFLGPQAVVSREGGPSGHGSWENALWEPLPSRSVPSLSLCSVSQWVCESLVSTERAGFLDEHSVLIARSFCGWVAHLSPGISWDEETDNSTTRSEKASKCLLLGWGFSGETMEAWASSRGLNTIRVRVLALYSGLGTRAGGLQGWTLTPTQGREQASFSMPLQMWVGDLRLCMVTP